MSALAIKGSGFTYWVMDGAVGRLLARVPSLVVGADKLDALERRQSG